MYFLFDSNTFISKTQWKHFAFLETFQVRFQFRVQNVRNCLIENNHFFIDTTRFVYKQRFFPTQAYCRLTFLWIKLQMFLRCCLIPITIIILYILYLVNLCLFLDLGPFMSYLCDLFFMFSLNLIIINHLISLKQTHLFFAHFLD